MAVCIINILALRRQNVVGLGSYDSSRGSGLKRPSESFTSSPSPSTLEYRWVGESFWFWLKNLMEAHDGMMKGISGMSRNRLGAAMRC